MPLTCRDDGCRQEAMRAMEGEGGSRQWKEGEERERENGEENGIKRGHNKLTLTWERPDSVPLAARSSRSSSSRSSTRASSVLTFSSSENKC